MLFNSIDFAIFLPIVFGIYWLLNRGSLNAQNLFVILASYFFYAWWDWRFLFLIVFSSFVDYFIGILLSNEQSLKKRKALLFTSVFVNLGFLGFFKYFNFFIDNFSAVFSFFGNPVQSSSLNIILPVGISFYTFQTLSYTIDVYRKKLEPTKDALSFFAFVSFFPQLVAGPIERATDLLPQFYKKRAFDYGQAVDGLRQILWGLIKKMVIADNCAIIANEIFNNSTDYHGYTLLLGSFFFAFQIYGDFSGYSDIAIGTSRLFGFNLRQNFAFPYFSRDIAEFWRRWHISLSSWFRDYLYIPLGGSRVSTAFKVRNTFIIFIISGFWHGANWTFIVWGLLNAIYFLPLLLFKRNRNNVNTVAPGATFARFSDISKIVLTFILTLFAWVFFRADSVSHAGNMIASTVEGILVNPMEILSFWRPYKFVLFAVFVFTAIEWLNREKKHVLENIRLAHSKFLRWSLYLILILVIYYFKGEQQEFIYFDF